MTTPVLESDPQTTGEAPRPGPTVIERFREVVAASPDRLALTSSGRSYTYAEIDRWSDRIATDIIAAGAPEEWPIAIVTSDNVSLAPAVIGVIKAGHFLLSLDATDPDERIDLILRESRATLCVVNSTDRVPAALSGHPLVAIGSLPATATPPPHRPPHPYVHVAFTSGTTGKPKAVITKQESLVEKTIRKAQRLGLGEGSRRSFTALPGFIRGASSILSAFLAGATLCSFDARGESLAALAEWIAREKITNLALTPSLFRRLVIANPPNLDFSNVTHLQMGADRITMADIEAFRKLFPRGCQLYHGYAGTELGGGVLRIVIDHDTPIPGPLVPMGRPYPDCEFRLIDEEGNEVADGEVGEIVVTSPHVADGYWNDPELTAQRFFTHPDRPGVRTFHTGDLAKRDGEGLYYFMGRKDARLKVQSRRIDPLEVEVALLATGELRDAVIVGKYDSHGELKLVAYVVMREGRPFAPRQLRAILRRHVPTWMVPARIYELDTIPITRAGKLDRTSLIDRIDPPIVRESGARDDLERSLCEIWSRVLDQAVNVDDDFFDDFGGESVVAAHLVTEIERETGRSLPLSLLIELNTVSKMAEHLRGTDETSRHVIRIQEGSTLPPLFCVAGGGGSLIVFRELAALIDPDLPFYGVQPHSFAPGTVPKTFSAIAACYADSIRQIQPEGPYYLAGYSMGGHLAYEIARQMTRCGDEVAFVGVIDTTAHTERASLWQRFLYRIEMLRIDPRRNFPRFAREAVNRPRGWAGRRVRNIIKAAAPHRIYDSFLEFNDARKDFRLGPYDGTLTLFRGRDGIRRVRVEPDLGWANVPLGRLDIVDVDGDHETLLAQPQVRSLADVFARALAAARNAVTS